MRSPGREQTGAVYKITVGRDDEQKHYPIPAADAISVARFLIEQQGLTQRDLIPNSDQKALFLCF
jgi:antitoxin component HigA of HigAB toxin-antitoxin module